MRRAVRFAVRALRRRCPNCGGGGLWRGWFHMQPECPACGLHLERGEHGYIVGAYMFNIIAAELVFAAIFVAVLIATWPSPPWTLLQFGGGALMILLPVLFYPFSKTLFLAFDLLFRPQGYEAADRAWLPVRFLGRRASYRAHLMTERDMTPSLFRRLRAPAVIAASTLAACMQSSRPRQMPGPMPVEPGAVSVSAASVPGVPGFSSAVRMGLTVHLSGQVALDSAANLVGPGDLRKQARQSLANLLSLVRAARGLPGDVVKLTFYVKGLDAAAGHVIQEASAEYFSEQPVPAVTMVGVASLPAAEFLVAVDGVAVLRGEFPDRQRVGAR